MYNNLYRLDILPSSDLLSSDLPSSDLPSSDLPSSDLNNDGKSNDGLIGDYLTDADFTNIDKWFNEKDTDEKTKFDEVEYIKIGSELIDITNKNIMDPSNDYRDESDSLFINFQKLKDATNIQLTSSKTVLSKKISSKIVSSKTVLSKKVSSKIVSSKKVSSKKVSAKKVSSKTSLVDTLDINEFPPIESFTISKSKKKCNRQNHINSKILNETKNYTNTTALSPKLVSNNKLNNTIKTVFQMKGVESKKSTCIHWVLGSCNDKICPNNFSHTLWTDKNTDYSYMKYWKHNDLSQKNITYSELQSFYGTKYYKSEKDMSKDDTFIISEQNNRGTYVIKNYLIYKNYE
jgi:hypothetical protein